MARDSVVSVSLTDISRHPAVEAWQRFGGGGDAPRQVFVLKPEKKRSAVYRLEGAGPGGTPVIAKRGRAARLATELLIYREVLPYVPAVTLACYGWLEDTQPGFSWLFLEDAGEERFSATTPEHRALAGRWLAQLHTSIACTALLESSLPGRGLEYYKSIVRLAGVIVRQSLTNPAFAKDDVSTLAAIVRCCERLESRWSALAEVCEVLPSTLVHGDFGSKNVRVRTDPDGVRLLPLDWDSAGWGIAATDLSQTDPAVYWSLARERWSALEPRELTRLATVGRMLLAIESITGEKDSLTSEWVGRVMRKMRSYELELTCALESTGWSVA